MVKFATLSVPLPDGGEEESLMRAKNHLRAVRYRTPLLMQREHMVVALGKRDGTTVAAIALILLFFVGLLFFLPLLALWFLGVIACFVVYRPNRVGAAGLRGPDRDWLQGHGRLPPGHRAEAIAGGRGG